MSLLTGCLRQGWLYSVNMPMNNSIVFHCLKTGWLTGLVIHIKQHRSMLLLSKLNKYLLSKHFLSKFKQQNNHYIYWNKITKRTLYNSIATSMGYVCSHTTGCESHAPMTMSLFVEDNKSPVFVFLDNCQY